MRSFFFQRRDIWTPIVSLAYPSLPNVFSLDEITYFTFSVYFNAFDFTRLIWGKIYFQQGPQFFVFSL